MGNRKTTSWIAIGLVALNTLWPLIASATAGPELPVVEICSIYGSKALQRHDTGSLPSQLPAGQHHFNHCAFCTGGACNTALPGMRLGAVAPSDTLAPTPYATRTPFGSTVTYLLALSRAPPVPRLI